MKKLHRICLYWPTSLINEAGENLMPAKKEHPPFDYWHFNTIT